MKILFWVIKNLRKNGNAINNNNNNILIKIILKESVDLKYEPKITKIVIIKK